MAIGIKIPNSTCSYAFSKSLFDKDVFFNIHSYDKSATKEEGIRAIEQFHPKHWNQLLPGCSSIGWHQILRGLEKSYDESDDEDADEYLPTYPYYSDSNEFNSEVKTLMKYDPKLTSIARKDQNINSMKFREALMIPYQSITAAFFA